MALACLSSWQQLKVDYYYLDSYFDSLAKIWFFFSFKLIAVSLLDILSLITTLLTEGARKNKYLFKKYNNIIYILFEYTDTDIKIDFVTNSDIYKITPGINQYSEYFFIRTSASKSISALYMQVYISIYSFFYTVLSNTKLWNSINLLSLISKIAITNYHL